MSHEPDVCGVRREHLLEARQRVRLKSAWRLCVLTALVCLIGVSPRAHAHKAPLDPRQLDRDTVAIVHAKAWTETADTPVENATVVLTEGKITAVGSGLAVPSNAQVVDAKGRPLTPGLVHPATHLGLLEVSAAADTVDSSTQAASLGADFDIQYGINSESALIELARSDGVTRAITYPVHSGKPPLSGTGALLRLWDDGEVLEKAGIGVFVVIGNHFGEPGASRAAQWAELRHALDDARKALASNKGSGPRTSEVEALEPVLAGKAPLAISTHRASDLRQAIRLAHDYQLRVIIIGGTEAWRVADELAAAKIPVILDPQDNLPSNFDQFGARLDNAALLHQAGVSTALAVLNGIHQSYNAGESMREGAGLAVANGLPYSTALRSITLTPAEIWGIADRTGSIAPGKDGDLVLWDGDPLEPTSAPVTVWIGGREVSLENRQTALRERYLRKAGLAVPIHRP